VAGTTKTELELRLETAEAWIGQLVQATQDAVITIDAESRIVLFNMSAEQMFGYTWNEARGRDVSMLMAEPYAHEHAGYVERYERTGEAKAIGSIRTVTARRKSGEEFPIELSVTKVTIDGKARYGAFTRDITEKARLQQALVERERLAAIGTTAAKFAHEVSNPLNGMFTQTQLLQRRLARTEDADERLVRGVERLLGDIDRLNGLLREFRSMSRRQEYRFSATPLALLCGELAESEGSMYGDRGIVLEVELPRDLPAVRADPPKLKQVLINLCKNAVEAMPAGGAIRVCARVDDGQVHVSVADTGCGIPEGVDVFAPFSTTKDAGTGLGLAIVQQIIEAHGGTISYTTEHGAGTTFELRLPVAADAPA
jgi:PAS domain S-box-containing protein